MKGLTILGVFAVILTACVMVIVHVAIELFEAVIDDESNNK